MSNVGISEFSMERCLQDMTYEILFGIFCELPKGTLIEISRLCSKFRDIAGDARLWRDVYIRYGPSGMPWRTNGPFAFEELYSEPWPVRVVDLSQTHVNPPVTSEASGRAVKVKRLNLSSISANEVTMEAILAKYQCTELYLDFFCGGHPMGIGPDAFSKQTALEVLSMKGIRLAFEHYCPWLVSVLNYCKNLKTLDLSYTYFTNDLMLSIVKNLPVSLEKLFIVLVFLEDSFFKLLAKSTPNLKELRLLDSDIKCPSLLKLQFLEILHIHLFYSDDVDGLDMYLVKFPALKTVYITYTITFDVTIKNRQIESFEALRKTLEPLGFIVKLVEQVIGDKTEEPPVDGNLWKVSKTV